MGGWVEVVRIFMLGAESKDAVEPNSEENTGIVVCDTIGQSQ